MTENSQINGDSLNLERCTQEYQVLHQVAQTLQTRGELKPSLKETLRIITQFEDLKVEYKAGIFLADEEKRVLRLFCTIGDFTDEFLEKEKEVPYGDCLCGRAAESGELLMSTNCFTDARHERQFDKMTAHGHYIVPLKSGRRLKGVMFLYTDTDPSWYTQSQEVLLSIGGLIANTIEQKTTEEELDRYRNHLEELVSHQTADLRSTNAALEKEITERRLIDEKLQASHQNLRNLGQRLQSLREDEKTRIAREVHDELGQSLTTLRMDLLCLQKELNTGQSDLRARIQSQVELIEGTIQSVQRICTELRPQILDVFGFCEAIAWQAREYEKRTGMEFALSGFEESIELERDLTTALFRIFQETVTNVIRHAEATRVSVDFRKEGDALQLSVADNGKGMDPAKVDDVHSLGLLGMRERILPWHGRVDFESDPGKGTRVRVTVPDQTP